MTRFHSQSSYSMRPLRVVALAGGAALALAGTWPSAPARAAGTSPIQHVVVLYLENHSFDNVLGYWCVQTGRCLGMPASVTLKGGTVVTPTTTPDTVPQINHLVRDQVAAMDIVNGVGKMDGWAAIGGCKPTQNYPCISGYQPSQIPNEIALANKFGISDHTFSMADSPSWGGHVYAVMATTDGFTGDNPVAASGVTPGNGWGCDSNKVTPWIQPGGSTTLEPSCIPDPALSNPNGGAFEPTRAAYAPTIMDRLNTASLPWKIYGSHNGQRGYNWATCPSIAECLYTPTQASNEVNSEQFVTDANNGQLPAFSLVVPGDSTTSSSQHNGTSMTRGDNWLGAIATAVQKGPEWGSTALFITYDDFGGFYDSVYPGTNTNPDGTQQGPRVPVVIVSPYAIPIHTDTTPATFASILAYTEQTFGLPPLSKNDDPAYGAYNFANAFNYSQAPLAPVAMRTTKLPGSALSLPPVDPNDPT